MILKPTLVPICDDLKISLEERKKILRNQMQRNRSLNSHDQANQPWSVNSGTRNLQFHYHRKESLPLDFKATVATLPPIEMKPTATTTIHHREVNVQSLAVDLDFVKKKTLNNITETL